MSTTSEVAERPKLERCAVCGRAIVPGHNIFTGYRHESTGLATCVDPVWIDEETGLWGMAVTTRQYLEFRDERGRRAHGSRRR